MPAPRTLILMRHAEAGGAYNDHERPLTPAGLIDAAAAGSWIRSALPEIDAVLCSTALRTRQTLSATGVGAPTRFAQELYGGGIDDILSQIALMAETARTVLVVGHAPGIPATAHELLTVAALVRADGGSGGEHPTGGDPRGSDPATGDSTGGDPTGGDPGENREHPAVDGLRHFSAGALAVLTTAASWATLDEQGADLQTVRHPHR